LTFYYREIFLILILIFNFSTSLKLQVACQYHGVDFSGKMASKLTSEKLMAEGI